MITVVEKPLDARARSAPRSTGESRRSSARAIRRIVTSPVGWVVGWFFSLFGVAIIGTLTGALVALVIDFLLKEGQGLGASGYQRSHRRVRLEPTARDLIDELRGDDYQRKVVVLAEADKNPAGDGVYFVSGDATEPGDLERAGIREASAALIFPADASNEADMRSILTIMAIEAIGARASGPWPRSTTRRHAEHFRRAKVDEILVTSKARLASARPVGAVSRA